MFANSKNPELLKTKKLWNVSGGWTMSHVALACCAVTWTHLTRQTHAPHPLHHRHGCVACPCAAHQVFRALGQAPTQLEFEKLVSHMDPKSKGVITWSAFLKEMERDLTKYFSKPADISRAFEKITKLSGEDAGTGAITIDEVTMCMENLGFKLPEDPEVGRGSCVRAMRAARSSPCLHTTWHAAHGASRRRRRRCLR